jgi:hypothetical protein
MLSQPTVFLLGAGASVPFDFPTGIQLVSRVLESLQNNDFRDKCGFEPETILRFSNALFRSGKNSVDAFLEHQPDLIGVGKSAIAFSLMNFEQEDALIRPRDANWLRYLYDRMNGPFETFGNNPVAFITFNYDRTVEYFFHTVLMNTYNKTAAECANQLVNIPIIHLHGHLGLLPWQAEAAGGHANSRQFEPNITPKSLRIASEGIKIIHEKLDSDRDRDFERAKRILANAKRTILLGFGFNNTNTERLGLADLEPAQTALATAFGLTQNEINSIVQMKLFRTKISIMNNDCISLFRNHVSW